MRAELHRVLPLPALLLLGLGSCYASNVVAHSDRAVAIEVRELVWQPATAADLAGLFVSTQITGEAAFSMRRIWYWFEPDGHFSGAALVAEDETAAFRTLQGSWRLEPDGLVLDGAPAVRVEVAEGHLRFGTDQGVVVLRREEQP